MYSLLLVYGEFASKNISKLHITQYNTTDITCTSDMYLYYKQGFIDAAL